METIRLNSAVWSIIFNSAGQATIYNKLHDQVQTIFISTRVSLQIKQKEFHVSTGKIQRKYCRNIETH